MRRVRARGGFTLVECLLASAILGFVSLALFEGVIVATRIAHENSELLAAEAVAWDAVWRRFNENFDRIALGTQTEDLAPSAAPLLSVYDTPPRLTVRVTAADEAGFSSAPQSVKKISADLEWGPAARRRRLSDDGQVQQVFRCRLGRAN